MSSFETEGEISCAEPAERLAQLVKYGKLKDPGANPGPLKICSSVSNAISSEPASCLLCICYSFLQFLLRCVVLYTT